MCEDWNGRGCLSSSFTLEVCRILNIYLYGMFFILRGDRTVTELVVLEEVDVTLWPEVTYLFVEGYGLVLSCDLRSSIIGFITCYIFKKSVISNRFYSFMTIKGISVMKMQAIWYLIKDFPFIKVHMHRR